MIVIPPPDPDAPPSDGRWVKNTAWFFAIAFASAFAWAGGAYILKALLH
jgi:hypothetical protein